MSNPDLIVVGESSESHESNKVDIVLSEVRHVLQRIHLTSTQRQGYIVIFDSIDGMNKKTMSALLKTLEEPPPGVIFILIAHKAGSLLPTVRSRCHRFLFHPLSHDEIGIVLRRILPGIPQGHLALYKTFAEGCPGRALALHNLGGFDFYRKILFLLKDLLKGQMSGLLDFLDHSNSMECGSFLSSVQGQNELVHFMVWLITRTFRMSLLGLRNNYELVILTPEEEEILSSLLAQHSLDSWPLIRSRITTLWSETESLNLNRQSALLEIFTCITGYSR